MSVYKTVITMKVKNMGRRSRAIFAALAITLFSLPLCYAQKSMEVVFQLPDTIAPFTIDEFYKVIIEYHPLVRQARLLSESAQQEVRLARGSFDPKAEVQVDKKEFQNKNYYNKLDAYLSFPTWFPVNPKVGMEHNTGQLLNNSETIPGGKQLFAGVALPVGRGLITDDRRAAVRQAELFTTIASADQVKIINKVLLQAAKDYWQWYHAYYSYRLMDRGTRIASEIFRRVKLNLEHGEASQLDTVQAKITLQTRLVERQEALLAFQNSGIILSNYLWNGSYEPVQLSLAVAPVLTAQDTRALSLETVQSLTDLAKQNHPELIKYRTKISQLEIERKLAKEYLKPKLDLNYAVLSQPSAPHEIDITRDYKFGLDFSMPVFLRKERSKYALSGIKIKNTQLEQSQAEREIINEINTTFNQLTNTSSIIAQQTEMVNLYDRLLEAEILNLESGESDLFKINLQQEKLIQAQTKLLKLKSEFEKTKATIYWAAGVRNLNIN